MMIRYLTPVGLALLFCLAVLRWGSGDGRVPPWAGLSEADAPSGQAMAEAPVSEEDANRLVALGMMLAERGRHTLAVVRFNEAIAKADANHPRLGQFHYARAQSLRQLGAYERALADFDRAVELQPDAYWVYVGRARALDAVDRLDDALSDLDRAIVMNRESQEAHVGRGAVLERMDRLDDALVAYTRALDLSPDHVFARVRRANLLRKMGETEQALDDYTHLVNQTGRPAAHRGRGRVYFDIGQYEAAIEDYSTAIVLNPSYYGSYYWRARSYQKMGQYRDAIQDFTRCVARNKDDHWAYYYRGRAYRSLGAYDAAIADFDRALALGHSSRDVYRDRGRTYEKQVNIPLARADYQRALDLDPDDTWTRRALARVGGDDATAGAGQGGG